MSLENKKILLIVGGGISAYKSLDLIRLLQRKGCSVKIILTRSGKKFVTSLSISSLSKNKVFEELVKHYNIPDHFSHKFKNFTTPGRLIKFSENLKNLKIDLNTSLYDATLILLENFKKTKNDIFLDFINFFLEIKFSEQINLKNKKSINLIKSKNNLMKLLYNYKNFNLSSTSVLDYIKRQESHA